MRISVREPAGPEVTTAAEGVRRMKSLSNGSDRLSISCLSITETLAAV
jgi:hypothetical protein